MSKLWCLHCKGDINPNHAQQGGLHMSCASKEIDVFTVTQNGARYCADISSLMDSLDAMEYDNEVIEIRKRKMTVLEYENIPEFTGF